MGEIRITQGPPEVQRTRGGVTVDPQAAAAPYAALQDVGRAISQGGDVAFKYHVQRQQLKDNAAGSRIRTQMKDVSAQIESTIQENADSPDHWENIAQSHINSMLNDTDLKGLGISESAAEKYRVDMESWAQETMIQVRSQSNRQKIRDDNAAIEAEAIDFMRNGDREGAKAILKMGSYTKEEFAKKWADVSERGVREEVGMEIQLNWNDEDGLLEIQERLEAKGKDNKYTNFYGLEYESRIGLQNQIARRLRGFERDRLTTANKYNNLQQKGELTIEMVNEAQSTGQIGVEEAAVLRQQVSALASIEEDGAAYDIIEGKLNSWWGERLVQTVNFMDGEGYQPSDKKYREILADIHVAELSRESKHNLLNKLFELKANDLSDGQEEKGRWWGDRELGALEVNLRTEMIEYYKANIGILGYEAAGNLLFQHEKYIREWFDNKDNPTIEEAEALKSMLTLQAGAAAATRQIDDTFSEL